MSSVAPVNVLLGIIRGIKLDDPINARNVQTTSSHVRAEEDSTIMNCQRIVNKTKERKKAIEPSLSIAEFKERLGALGLLLLAVQREDIHVNVIEKLSVVLNRVDGGEEHNDLLLEVFLNNGDEIIELRRRMGKRELP